MNKRNKRFLNKRFLSMMAAAFLLPLSSSSVNAQNSSAQPSAEETHNATSLQWPKGPQASKGAPNVVLILIDDVGFSATSTFGGEIATPTFEQLAKQGLRRCHSSGEGW
jgi:hypothetical protein